MTDPQTNLKVLKRSRTKPETGDVFAMQLPDDSYIFGRVVGAELDPPLAPMPLAFLIYVYSVRSFEQQPDLGALLPDRLLLPPVFINRMPWTKGYFKNVAHEELKPHLLLRQYCFWDAARALCRRATEPLAQGGSALWRWGPFELPMAR